MSTNRTIGVRAFLARNIEWLPSALLVAALAVYGGCAQSLTGDLGVTGGGQQDIAAARLAVQSGEIPDPDAITVEGFLSEHDLPVTTPDDAGVLFATTAASWNRDFDAFTPLATLQIGFGTTVDAATFQRSPLNLCLVIDRSGSMGDFVDGRSRTTKFDAVRIAIDRLAAQLTAEDRISIVTFNSGARIRLENVAGNDLPAIKSAIERVEPDGGTELALGLTLGYRTVQRHSRPGLTDRLMVFTDAQLTERSQLAARAFINVMEDYAEEGIGATILGIGTNFGHEIAYDISQVRGGNYFFLSDYDRIVSVFDDEFDFLVTPVAYDVRIGVSVPFELDVVSVHGLPEDVPLTHSLQLSLPTLFLSGRQGGGIIMLRLRAGAGVDFATETEVAEVTLSYMDRNSVPATPETLTAVLPAGLAPSADPAYFPNDTAKRAVLLLNTALVLKAACQDVYDPFGIYGYYYYYSDPQARERAVTRLTEFLSYFDALSAGLPDRTSENSRALSQERQLIADLLRNIQGF